MPFETDATEYFSFENKTSALPCRYYIKQHGDDVGSDICGDCYSSAEVGEPVIPSPGITQSFGRVVGCTRPALQPQGYEVKTPLIGSTCRADGDPCVETRSLLLRAPLSVAQSGYIGGTTRRVFPKLLCMLQEIFLALRARLCGGILWFAMSIHERKRDRSVTQPSQIHLSELT